MSSVADSMLTHQEHRALWRSKIGFFTEAGLLPCTDSFCLRQGVWAPYMQHPVQPSIPSMPYSLSLAGPYFRKGYSCSHARL